MANSWYHFYACCKHLKPCQKRNRWTNIRNFSLDNPGTQICFRYLIFQHCLMSHQKPLYEGKHRCVPQNYSLQIWGFFLWISSPIPFQQQSFPTLLSSKNMQNTDSPPPNLILKIKAKIFYSCPNLCQLQINFCPFPFTFI